MNNLRVVLDTNLVVSAMLLPQSRPRQALDYVRRHGIVLVSADALSELREVIRRPRFNRYLLEGQRREFLYNLEQDSELVPITHSITACRDPNDDKFLELAVSGNASQLITGDDDLLALHPFRNIPIITPATFLTRQIR